MSERDPHVAAGTDDDRAFREAAAKVAALQERQIGAGRTVCDGREKLAIAALIVIMGLGWAHTFHEMWYRWFEGWRQTDWPLWDRLTKGDSYYTHGPIVPLVSLFMAFFIYRGKKIGLPVQRTFSSNLVASLGLAISLLSQLFAARADVMFVSGFALLGVIASMVLLGGGWPLLRAYWLPMAVLSFMVPLPMDAIARLNYQLKYFATEQAMWLTNSVIGIPAVLDGSRVILQPEPDGTPKMLVVENVCGGLRSLISLTFFAALFAAVCRVKGWWRLLILSLAVPVAVLSNIMRITSMNVVAHYVGMDEVGEGGGFHDFSGLMVFVVALALLFAIEQVIIHVGRWLKRDWVDNRLLGYLDPLVNRGGDRLRVYRPMAMAAVGGTVALSFYWSYRSDTGINSGTEALTAVPKSVTIATHDYTSTDSPIDAQTRAILQTDDYLFRHFVGPTGRFDLMLVFSPNNRKGTHPPEVCIEGSGSQIVQKDTIELDNVVAGQPLMTMQELVADTEGYEVYHLYVYKCGGHYTHRYLTQQFLIFLNGLTDRNSTGALIRFDVPVTNGQVDIARQMAVNAVRSLMPGINERLP